MRNNTPRASRLPLLLEGTFLLLLIFTLATPAFAAVAPDVQTYEGLVRSIHEVMAQSDVKVDVAVNQVKVREAWEIGRLIDEHVLLHKERGDYGTQTLKRLYGDIGIPSRELSYMVRFFRFSPAGPPTEPLSWRFYKVLSSVEDNEVRQELAQQAVREHWTRDRLYLEVHKQNPSYVEEEIEKIPTAVPGKTDTYRVVKSEVEGSFQGKLCLDLGFANFFQTDGINQFKEGDVVTFENGKFVSADDGQPFTYTAYVTKLIDGDTIQALVDLGFHVITKQKLRLRAIDAPELDTVDGRESKEFLEKQGICPGAKILIKTKKSDKYDRYLTDVWIDGKYINQLLVDEGLAVMAAE